MADPTIVDGTPLSGHGPRSGFSSGDARRSRGHGETYEGAALEGVNMQGRSGDQRREARLPVSDARSGLGSSGNQTLVSSP
jgi:hypothetical protein